MRREILLSADVPNISLIFLYFGCKKSLSFHTSDITHSYVLAFAFYNILTFFISTLFSFLFHGFKISNKCIQLQNRTARTK
jgi:4-amino-4-deoxy-L-arabinose transferase-like glycosyltransferase